MTEITYSDIKTDEQGREFVTIYFETPSEDLGFCDASIDYPDGIFYKVHGYNDSQLKELEYHYKKIGSLAFEFAKEAKESCRNL